MDVLSNGKVSLRPIEKRDLDKLNQWKNDENVYRFLGGGFLPVSRDIQEKWLESLMDTTGSNKRFIIENGCREAVGMIGLYRINWIHRTCELGIFIGESSQQGKGYGSSAYRLLEEYGAKYLNLRKITAEVVEKNKGAVSFYENLCFQQAGRLSKQRFIGGEYCDLLIMEKFLGCEPSRRLSLADSVFVDDGFEEVNSLGEGGASRSERTGGGIAG